MLDVAAAFDVSISLSRRYEPVYALLRLTDIFFDDVCRCYAICLRLHAAAMRYYAFFAFMLPIWRYAATTRVMPLFSSSITPCQITDVGTSREPHAAMRRFDAPLFCHADC